MSVVGWGTQSSPGGWTTPAEDRQADGRRLLAEFLLARNSEVLEASARIHHDGCATRASAGAGCDCGYPDMIAAECSARWRVVSLAQRLDRWSGLHSGVAGEVSQDHLTVLYEVMAALATAYADHPDYRPELW